MIYDELEKRNYFLNARCTRVNPHYEIENMEFMMQKDWHSFNKRKDRISNLFHRQRMMPIDQVMNGILVTSEQAIDLLEEAFNQLDEVD